MAGQKKNLLSRTAFLPMVFLGAVRYLAVVVPGLLVHASIDMVRGRSASWKGGGATRAARPSSPDRNLPVRRIARKRRANRSESGCGSRRRERRTTGTTRINSKRRTAGARKNGDPSSGEEPTGWWRCWPIRVGAIANAVNAPKDTKQSSLMELSPHDGGFGGSRPICPYI